MKPILKLTAFILVIWLVFFISCKKENSCENCGVNPPGSTNKSPIAIAGPDQVITLPTDSILLNGSNSTDPDGTISSYLWTKISGPVSFSITNSSAVTTVIKSLVRGSYQFELKITDNGGFSAKDTLQVIVNDPSQPNRPPFANAGTDQTITLPTNTVTLNGSSSTDPDNNITGYVWTKISGPSTFSIVNANTAETQATNLIQGIYQFELKVTDAGGLFSKDTLQVTVNSMTSNNFSPIAHAGTDISVNYDLQTCSINPTSFTLNGTASTDPDGTIVSYLWTGPGVLASPNAAITNVSNITFGYNEFILKVTDNNGAIDTDTILVNVVSLMNRPIVPAQLIPIGTLSQSRSSFALAAAGNKLVFAGGWINNGSSPSSAKVDIYDISTGGWTTSQLSEGRFGIGVAVLGNKIFFGGGGRQQNNGWGSWQYGGLGSSVVDIFDVANNSWSVAQLSSPRVPVGASAGNKVVFAGGDDLYGSSRADVFDGITNTWTSHSLSESRHISQIAVSGNKIFLAGGSGGLSGVGGNGITKKIDILDASTGVWSVDFLSFERGEMGAIGANNKIYWGGGAIVSTHNIEYDVTNTVEIRDLVTNTTSFKCLSEPKLGLTALKKDNKILFFGGGENNKFDIYDLSTGFWSIGVLSQNLLWPSIISVSNTIYVAGGYVNGVLSNQVWKLEF